MTQIFFQFPSLFLLVAAVARAAQVHTIKVGYGGSFVFEPELTSAEIGDRVVFDFFPTNHSVVRGEYCGSTGCNPCIPYELFHKGAQGFHSDNVLIQAVSTSANDSTFDITIGDKLPIWFYCTALESCNPNGMIGVINPATGQSIANQKTMAYNAKYQLSPGQKVPAEGSQPAAPSTSLKPKPTLNTTGSQRISSGTIAGIVIGVLLLTALSAATIFFFVRRFKHRNSTATPELDSTPLNKFTDVEEQEVLVAMSQDDVVSPISPQQPQRKKSILDRAREIYYRYPRPFSEKLEEPTTIHPAFRNSNRRFTEQRYAEPRYTELEGGQDYHSSRI